MSKYKGYSVEKYKAGGKGAPAVYLVKNASGFVVGLLEKYPNSRTDTHPWKAFTGRDNQKFLGVSYAKNGKEVAVEAIITGKEILEDAYVG